jgi:hypothetical protein
MTSARLAAWRSFFAASGVSASEPAAARQQRLRDQQDREQAEGDAVALRHAAGTDGVAELARRNRGGGEIVGHGEDQEKAAGEEISRHEALDPRESRPKKTGSRMVAGSLVQ